MKKLEELEKVIEFEKTSNCIVPKPTYLYIGNYGRKASEYANQFTEFSGKDDYFCYKPRPIKDKDLESSFDNEVNRHKPLGKEYDGVIIVDLSLLMEDMEKVERLICYVKDFYSNNYIVFELREASLADEMLELLNSHFFTRKLKAQEYEDEEMLGLISAVVEEYNSALSEEEIRVVLDWATGRNWGVDDEVESKIVSKTKDIIYEIGISQMDEQCRKEMIKELLDRDAEHKNSRAAIGFQLGG